MPTQTTSVKAEKGNKEPQAAENSATPVITLESNDSAPEENQTPSIEELWHTYEAWLSEHFEKSLEYLNPAVTEDHLLILEKSLNNNLPDDYRAWLKTHNGQTVETTGLLFSNEFLSVSRLLEEWLGMKKLCDSEEHAEGGESIPKGAIKPVWWDTNWLPISADGSGKLVCIDLTPSDKGVDGQIIDVDYKTAQRQVLANSFTEYVATYISDLELKEYRYSKEHGKLVPNKSD